MKRHTTVRTGRALFAGNGVHVQFRRWRSYDQSALDQEALLNQVESHLGHDVEGKPLRVNAGDKTVTTAAGSLPLSPIMDPAWIKSRRKQKKREPGIISGQFRKRLSNNPFAEALMTPLRYCSNTEVLLPRYFLQDLEIVQHPEHPSEHWVMPGPLSTHGVIPNYESGPYSPTGRARSSANNAESESNRDTTEEPLGATIAKPHNTSSAENSRRNKTVEEGRRRSPLLVYCISRKSFMDSLGNSAKASSRLKSRALFTRTGAATTAYQGPDTVWNPEMGNLILKHQRRVLVDALIYRANRSVEPDFKFLQAVKSWDEVKDVEKRGSVLWFAGKPDPMSDSYATLDVDARWWSKMPVHNLGWLLGDEEAKRLRESSEVFENNNIVVLKLWRSLSLRKLHLLLWRLQGYLAEQTKPALEDGADRID